MSHLPCRTRTGPRPRCPDWAAPVARGPVGIRLPISRFRCKVKLSQDKDPQTQRRVIEALRRPGPYQHARLADEMERTLGHP